MDTDQELKMVEEAKGDIHVFDRLYEYYLPKIHAYCRNRVSSVEVAEDLTSRFLIYTN
ncbi:MAG: RNA polymerase sigma factor [Candidatus Dojkabacteria bacterium]